MPVVELRPDGAVTVPAAFTAVGAPTTTAALADDLNTSWVDVQINLGQIAVWSLSTAILSATQRVAAHRIRAGILAMGGDMGYEVYDASQTKLGAFFFTTDLLPPEGKCNPGDPNCYAQQTGILYSPWVPRLGGTQEITQTVLDGLVFRLDSLALPVGQVASIAVEVDVRNQPVVAVNQTVATAVAAAVTWVAQPQDGDLQSGWEIAVFSTAQSQVAGFNPATSTATYRAKGTGAANSAIVAAHLVVSQTYFAYVRISKKLGYDTSGLWPGLEQEWFSQWAFNTIFVSPVDTATYVAPIPTEGKLGCHDWVVTVAARGGGSLVEIPWTQLSWGRRLQDISQATVSFPRSVCTALPWLGSLDSWKYEVGVWRDSEKGYIEEWVGPLVGRSGDRDSMTLRARDWFTLFEHRQIHGDYSLNDIDLATIFAAFGLDAVSVDNSANIGLAIRSTGVVGSRVVLASEHRRSADMLRDLGRSGVDWTMIGRTLLAGGVELPLPACRLLIDEHVEKVDFNESGESTATSVTVIGKTESNVATVGTASVVDLDRGVLETVVTASDVADQQSANVYASSVLDLLGSTPEEWTIILSEHAQSGFGRLIPGARYPVDLQSVNLLSSLRLTQLDVSAQRTPDGAVGETVTVRLSGLGQQDIGA